MVLVGIVTACLPTIAMSNFLLIVSNNVHYTSIVVLSYSRYCADVKSHLLDLLLTNEANMIDKISYSSGLGKSNHVCITFRVKCSSVHNFRKQPTVSRPN